MSVSAAISQIYNKADEMGINLQDFGIHDEEDLTERALTSFLDNMDVEFDYETLDMQSWNPENDEEDSATDEFDSDDAWDFSLEDIERLIGRRDVD